MADFQATCGTADFPELCNECRSQKQWVKVGKGKTAARHLICLECETVPAPKKRPITKRAAKVKGNAGEDETVAFVEACGFDGQRTVASGATGSRTCESAFDTDVIVRFADTFRKKVESKRLANVAGLTSMQAYLAGSQLLRVRQDNQKAFWFLPEAEFGEILKWAAEGMRSAKGRA